MQAGGRSQGGLDALRGSQREQALAQKLISRGPGTVTSGSAFAGSASVEHPRAPRPTSGGVRRTGATPRARSWTERGSSGGSNGARGPSPTRSPDEKGQGYQPSANGVNRRPGGPLPPALPLLRQ